MDASRTADRTSRLRIALGSLATWLLRRFKALGRRLRRTWTWYGPAGASRDGDVVCALERTWSTDHGLGIQGWIFSRSAPLDRVELAAGGVAAPVVSWEPRPDVQALHPDLPVPEACGFWVHIPRPARHEVTVTAVRGGRTDSRTHRLQGCKPPRPPECEPSTMALDMSGDQLFRTFAEEVNDRKLRVLEIGSRVVCPGSASKRALFPRAASYTGFDFYPDANTDVLGDAHRLSGYFEDRRFDAVFSLAVLEHLAMPWIVAREIAKLLEPGGITYHWTTFAWPAHHRPSDYWRFSDDGLRMLFAPGLGYNVLRAAVYDPVRMYFDDVQPGYEAFPVHPAYASAALLARKVSEPDLTRFQWELPREQAHRGLERGLASGAGPPRLDNSTGLD